MRHGLRGWHVAVPAVFAAASMAIAGPDWVEIGDAGNNLDTAQIPTGTSGQLQSISGTLTGTGLVADFEDCYVIRIVNPTIFSATITAADFNTQLTLYNITLPGGAYGLLGNDDQAVGNNLSRMTNTSTDGTNVFVTLPGDYMISVSGTSRHPVALSGPGGQTGRIFNYASATEVSGPDGPGGFNALTGWTGNGESGSYTVTLTGCDFPVFPAPGTGMVLAMAGLAIGRRKR